MILFSNPSIIKFSVICAFFHLLYTAIPVDPPEQKEIKRLEAWYKELVKILSDENDIPKAEKYLSTLPEKEDDLSLLLKNCAKARVESFKSNYFNGNFYLFEALKYAEKVKLDYFLFEIHHQLAINLRQQNQVDEALAEYKKAIFYVKKLNRPKDEALLYNNFGLAYFHKKNLDSAEYYFTRSHQLYSDAGQGWEMAFYHVNMMEILHEKKLFDQALAELNRGKDVLYSLNNAGLNTQIDLSYFKIYKAKQEWQLAKLHLEKALQNGIKTEHKKILHEIYEGLSEVNHVLGHQNEAWENQRKVLELEKAINEQDLELKLQSARYGYEFEKQIALNEIQELQIQIEKRKNIAMLTGLAAMLVFIGFLYYLYRAIAKKNNLIMHQKDEIERVNMQLTDLNSTLELKILERTQDLKEVNEKLSEMNDELADSILKGKTIERSRLASSLHDNLGGIFTALQWNVRALDFDSITGKNKSILLKLKDSIENGYSEVRNISHNLLPKAILENSLLEAARILENDLNINQDMHFKIHIDPSISLSKNEEYEIYLVLMELCTNTIKHSDGDNAEISMRLVNGVYEMAYYDNGSQFNNYWNSNGMGLQNIEKRLDGVGVSFTSGRDHNFKS